MNKWKPKINSDKKQLVGLFSTEQITVECRNASLLQRKSPVDVKVSARLEWRVKAYLPWNSHPVYVCYEEIIKWHYLLVKMCKVKTKSCQLNALLLLTIYEVKFIYSEKTTKFCEIFPLLLSAIRTVKSKGKISQTFVAFSEYMNFTYRVNYPQFDTELLVVAVGDVRSKLPNPLLN